ncbi:MAG TPA: DEAD/DEAH box helicase family protein, partial [Methanosarcinales archaeon]|nr:DEAD/DEAH box helicase family protein [Methanosarcinales archaeon]
MNTETKTKDDIQQLGLDAIGNRKKSGVVATMGSGKCLLGLKHMAKNYNELASYLVVTPRKTIYKSWTDDAKEYGFDLFLEHLSFVSYRSLIKLDFNDYDVIYLDECHSLKYSHKEWLLEFEAKGGIIVGLTGTYPIYKNTEKGKMCNYFC